MAGYVAIEGQFKDPDGHAASGSVCLTPSGTLTDSSFMQPLAPVCGLLDPEGRIISQAWGALTVLANDDAHPDGSNYTITVRVDGSPTRECQVTVLANSTATESRGETTMSEATVLLTDLIASSTMVGQSITGDHIPGGTTVTDFDEDLNELAISHPATATATGCSFVVGGAVNLEGLLA